MLNLFRMGFFGAAHRWGGSPSLKSVTDIIVMKLDTVIPYLNKLQKVYESRDTYIQFC